MYHSEKFADVRMRSAAVHSAFVDRFDAVTLDVGP